MALGAGVGSSAGKKRTQTPISSFSVLRKVISAGHPYFGKKTKTVSLKMIKNGFVNLIGSDAHNTKKRNFCLLDAYSAIETMFDKDIVDILKRNTVCLLKGEIIQSSSLTQLESYNPDYFEKICNYIKKIFLKFNDNEN